MNLNELREAMASDATKENERLKSETNLLRKQLSDLENDYAELKKSLNDDCRALANRCFTLTRGTMCCFCELNEFRCQHALNDDQKIKIAKKLMKENKQC